AGARLDRRLRAGRRPGPQVNSATQGLGRYGREREENDMTDRHVGDEMGQGTADRRAAQSPAAKRAGDLMPAGDARSLRTVGEAALWFETDREGAVAVLAPSSAQLLDRFVGGEASAAGAGLTLLRAPASPATAASLREVLPNLRPVPLGLMTSAGFGDRLGMATPGHVEALRRTAATGVIAPIFAQQSIREMTRTRRTAQQVMDDATFGAFAAGWEASVGADADHLKTEQNVLDTVAAGFTFFTIDPSEHVDDEA